MKQKFLRSNLIIGFASVILITSCSRDVTSPHPVQSSSQSSPKVLNLVADHWQQQGPESVYINAFYGIMQGRPANARVYIVTDTTEMLLSSGGTTFMSGEIWSTTTSTDLILNYRDFNHGSLPFGYLNVKVVFE